MKAAFRTYQAGDEARMAIRPDMAAEFAALGERVHDGQKWAFVEGDHVLGVGGLAYDEADDSFDLWGLAGGMRPRHWVQVFTFVRSVIEATQRTVELGAPVRRVWVVASPCKGAEDFIRRLGFQPSAKKGVFYV